MKKLTVKKGSTCMACLECVRACSQAFYKEFHQDKACIKIVEKKGEAKPQVCVQCGKCAKVCEVGAITQNPKTGVYMINKKLCNGCGKCAEICPGHTIQVGRTARIHPSGCIRCFCCHEMCPVKAIDVRQLRLFRL